MSEPTVFTIGHSTHPLPVFTGLLAHHGIDCIIDVRSTPYSARVPHFNREYLRKVLKEQGITYIHMPDEFGARKSNPEFLDQNSRVDFDLVRQSPSFQTGLARLRRGLAQGFRLSLMCSEADPFDCHRFSMISYQLTKDGLRVKHILRDGTLIDNSVLEQRLLQRYWPRYNQHGLFEAPKSTCAHIDEAYRLRGREVAYSPTEISQ